MKPTAQLKAIEHQYLEGETSIDIVGNPTFGAYHGGQFRISAKNLESK